MKYIKILLTAALVCPCAVSLNAQTIVEMSVNQNPLFEVSTNSVNAVYPEEGGSMTLGADLVIAGGSGNYTYRWYDAAGNELGDGPTLTVDGEGKYLLDVSDECDCLQTVEFNVETASVKSVEGNIFRITPNPTEGYVEFGGIGAMQVCLTSMTGQLVAVLNYDGQPMTSADLSFLTKGTYILTLTDVNGKTQVCKLIKK